MIEVSREANLIVKSRMWLPEDPKKLKAEDIRQLAASVAWWAMSNMEKRFYDMAIMELELAMRLAEKLKEVDR